jgi:hypothetical protein
VIAHFFEIWTHPSQTEHFCKWPQTTELSIAEDAQSKYCLKIETKQVFISDHRIQKRFAFSYPGDK